MHTFDDLAELTREYPMSETQVSLFRERGHLLVRQVASAAIVSSFRPLIHQIVEQVGREERSRYEREDFGGSFLELTNLWDRDAVIRPLTLAPRFAKMAAELLGVSSVRLHYDCALFKGPHSGRTPWHQDQSAWPLDTDRTLTMWMPLSDLDENLGSLTFLSGSHRMGETTLAKAVRKGLREVQYGAMKAGDATFHHGWTFHSAGPNPFQHTRDVFAVTYYADGAILTNAGDRAAQSEHMQRFFPGLEQGKPATGRLHPIVYSKSDPVGTR